MDGASKSAYRSHSQDGLSLENDCNNESRQANRVTSAWLMDLGSKSFVRGCRHRPCHLAHSEMRLKNDFEEEWSEDEVATRSFKWQFFGNRARHKRHS